MISVYLLLDSQGVNKVLMLGKNRKAKGYFLNICCHSVLSLTTIRTETFNPG